MGDNFDERGLAGWGRTAPDRRDRLRRSFVTEAMPGGPRFAVERREDDEGAITIAFIGEIDRATAPAAEEHLRLAERERRPILVDLRRLRFIDSNGLHILIGAHRRIREAGRRLVLVRGPRPVHQVFEITRQDERLEIVDHA